MATAPKHAQLLAPPNSIIFVIMGRPEECMADSSENLFSAQSFRYARYRPSYPRQLCSYLAAKVPSRKLAWDAGCGTGQASVAFGDFFDRVYATDPSPEQIAQAAKHPRVEYAVEPAEQVSLAPHEVDLVTAAASLHWFDSRRFFAESRRVLRTDGIIAVWGYSVPLTTDLKPLVSKLYWPQLQPYWPTRLKELFGRYGSLSNFFTEFAWDFLDLPAPKIEMEVVFNRDEFLNYLGRGLPPRPIVEA